MARPIPGQIKDNFANYLRFLSDSKSTEHGQIKLSRSGAKKNFVGRSAVIYAALEGEKAFEAEISVEDNSHYFFRLFAYWFDSGPCLRFDSKGRSHCNPENGEGLRKRQVLTPHFHRFDEKEKVEIAYKTPKLRGADCHLIVGDYRRGLEHFCQEARLCYGHTGQPVLEIIEAELDLSSEDPLNGVNLI
jgi:hypothetical protein